VSDNRRAVVEMNHNLEKLLLLKTAKLNEKLIESYLRMWNRGSLEISRQQHIMYRRWTLHIHSVEIEIFGIQTIFPRQELGA